MEPTNQPSMQPMSPEITGGMATEEQKQQLMDLIAKIKEQLGNVKATKFAADSKSEEFRQELLREVFKKMQQAGVDLNDRASVSEFIARLQEQNPELAQIFENSMDVLLGGQPQMAGIGEVESEPEETGMIG